MELEHFGIRMKVPPNALAAGQSELIKLSVITDLTDYVPLDDDEIFPAFGIQCLPDGMQLNQPIVVTMPHCVKLSNPGNVTPILYSGRIGLSKLCHDVALYLYTYQNAINAHMIKQNN